MKKKDKIIRSLAKNISNNLGDNFVSRDPSNNTIKAPVVSWELKSNKLLKLNAKEDIIMKQNLLKKNHMKELKGTICKLGRILRDKKNKKSQMDSGFASNIVNSMEHEKQHDSKNNSIYLSFTPLGSNSHNTSRNIKLRDFLSGRESVNSDRYKHQLIVNWIDSSSKTNKRKEANLAVLNLEPESKLYKNIMKEINKSKFYLGDDDWYNLRQNLKNHFLKKNKRGKKIRNSTSSQNSEVIQHSKIGRSINIEELQNQIQRFKKNKFRNFSLKEDQNVSKGGKKSSKRSSKSKRGSQVNFEDDSYQIHNQIKKFHFHNHTTTGRRTITDPSVVPNPSGVEKKEKASKIVWWSFGRASKPRIPDTKNKHFSLREDEATFKDYLMRVMKGKKRRSWRNSRASRRSGDRDPSMNSNIIDNFNVKEANFITEMVKTMKHNNNKMLSISFKAKNSTGVKTDPKLVFSNKIAMQETFKSIDKEFDKKASGIKDKIKNVYSFKRSKDLREACRPINLIENKEKPERYRSVDRAKNSSKKSENQPNRISFELSGPSQGNWKPSKDKLKKNKSKEEFEWNKSGGSKKEIKGFAVYYNNNKKKFRYHSVDSYSNPKSTLDKTKYFAFLDREKSKGGRINSPSKRHKKRTSDSRIKNQEKMRISFDKNNYDFYKYIPGYHSKPDSNKTCLKKKYGISSEHGSEFKWRDIRSNYQSVSRSRSRDKKSLSRKSMSGSWKYRRIKGSIASNNNDRSVNKKKMEKAIEKAAKMFQFKPSDVQRLQRLYEEQANDYNENRKGSNSNNHIILNPQKKQNFKKNTSNCFNNNKRKRDPLEVEEITKLNKRKKGKGKDIENGKVAWSNSEDDRESHEFDPEVPEYPDDDDESEYQWTDEHGNDAYFKDGSSSNNAKKGGNLCRISKANQRVNSYYKNQNLFISSSFLMQNDKLEEDLLSINAAKNSILNNELGAEMGIEYKVNTIMKDMEITKEGIIRNWEEAVYVLKQRHLILSYLNWFEKILEMFYIIICNFPDFMALNFEIFDKNCENEKKVNESNSDREIADNDDFNNNSEIECELNTGADEKDTCRKVSKIIKVSNSSQDTSNFYLTNVDLESKDTSPDIKNILKKNSNRNCIVSNWQAQMILVNKFELASSTRDKMDSEKDQLNFKRASNDYNRNRSYRTQLSPEEAKFLKEKERQFTIFFRKALVVYFSTVEEYIDGQLSYYGRLVSNFHAIIWILSGVVDDSELDSDMKSDELSQIYSSYNKKQKNNDSRKKSLEKFEQKPLLHHGRPSFGAKWYDKCIANGIINSGDDFNFSKDYNTRKGSSFSKTDGKLFSWFLNSSTIGFQLKNEMMGAFERIFYKLKDKCHSMEYINYAKIVDALANLLDQIFVPDNTASEQEEYTENTKNNYKDNLDNNEIADSNSRLNYKDLEKSNKRRINNNKTNEKPKSEPKLNIIECLSNNKEVNVLKSLTYTTNLQQWIMWLNHVFDSRISWPYLKIACARLAPFVNNVMEALPDNYENIDYLIVAANLASLLIKTRKNTDWVVDDITGARNKINAILTNFLIRLFGCQKSELMKNFQSLAITFLHLKKYFQTSATVPPSQIKVRPERITNSELSKTWKTDEMGISDLERLSGVYLPFWMDDTFSMNFQNLIKITFKHIFFDTLSVEKDGQYVELFYTMIDAFIEYLKCWKQTNNYLKTIIGEPHTKNLHILADFSYSNGPAGKENTGEGGRKPAIQMPTGKIWGNIETNLFETIREDSRKMIRQFITSLDLVEKNGVRGKICESLLIMIWKMTEIVD